MVVPWKILSDVNVTWIVIGVVMCWASFMWMCWTEMVFRLLIDLQIGQDTFFQDVLTYNWETKKLYSIFSEFFHPFIFHIFKVSNYSGFQLAYDAEKQDCMILRVLIDSWYHNFVYMILTCHIQKSKSYLGYRFNLTAILRLLVKIICMLGHFLSHHFVARIQGSVSSLRSL